MIPKTIHQIFWDFSGENKTLNDFPIFQDCNFVVEQRSKSYGFEHKVWSYKDCEDLLKYHYPHYLQLWDDFSEPVMKCDFIRYIILYHYGGIYMDMDMYPLRDFTEFLSHTEVFATWHDDDKRLPYIALMMSEKGNPLFMEIAEHSKASYYEKITIRLYQTWTGRLVFQTTGHRMVYRVLKKRNIKPWDILRINTKDKVIEGDSPYFEDFNASLWYTKKEQNLYSNVSK